MAIDFIFITSFSVLILERPDGKLSGHIYLYALSISVGVNELVPIFSMLSECHNANFISYWLKEFVRLGGSVPNEFCIDMSLALSNAVVNAYTSHKSLTDYADYLFSLNFDSSKPKPELYLRFDIAHVLAHVAKCRELTNKKPKVREIYIRCVGLLITETNISEARRIISSVFVMAYSSTEGLWHFIFQRLITINFLTTDCMAMLTLGWTAKEQS